MSIVKREQNPQIGNIEKVGKDGFIVESCGDEEGFHGGKRIIKDFDTLIRFLADHLEVYQGEGSRYGVKPAEAPGNGHNINTPISLSPVAEEPAQPRLGLPEATR